MLEVHAITIFTFLLDLGSVLAVTHRRIRFGTVQEDTFNVSTLKRYAMPNASRFVALK